jgi:hypothetical protein
MVPGFRDLVRLWAGHTLKRPATQIGSSERAALKKWLVRTGSFLAVAGGVFVLHRLWSYKDSLNLELWGWQEWTVVGALACAYAVINGLLALGWHYLLRHRNEHQPIGWSLHVYAVTQISKYIPGNVFQFAGRQIMGATAGAGQRSLLYSTAMEFLLLIAAAMCFFPSALSVFFPGLHPFFTTSFAILLLVMLPPSVCAIGGKRLCIAAAAYTVFVTLSGAIFLGVLMLSAGIMISGHDMVKVVGAFAVSWLVGLLTPGAPAGIGVREAILLLLLDDLASESAIITSVVTARVVTILGDVLFFGMGLLVGGRNGRSAWQAGPDGG